MKDCPTCRTCLILRPFLAVACMLIILIWLRPDGLVTMAGFFPANETLVAVMMGVGTLGFGLRYLGYRRSGCSRDV